ncbi:MAG: hypothetical protein PHC62_04280 [Candidatus Izemoplasmatales bacterium]|nr:hypothetical protein [Candidatus Izemoplasmatales bacterium]
MKKLLVLLTIALVVFPFHYYVVKAEEYLTYQEIVLDNDNAKLLKYFTDNEYENYYQEIKKKKFIGWSIGIVNSNEELEFISETKLKIINDGYSTIKHNITLLTKAETKYQISASGSVSVSIKGDIKKFKGGLDADIKASITYTKNVTSSEEYEFNIIVDPETYVSIVTRGKAEVSNGVAKYYLFWIETKKGGWETFTVTTEYYEIIKEKMT